MATPSGSLELDGEDLRVARATLVVLEEARRRQEARSLPGVPASFRLSELRAELLRARVFEDPSRLLGRLRRRGLLDESFAPKGDKVFVAPHLADVMGLLREAVERLQAPPPSALQPPPDEALEIREMDAVFFRHLREILQERLEETLEFARGFDLGSLLRYTRELFGEELGLDPALALLQQYALADVPLITPSGRASGTTGFHLALFGPPGTGKTFAIDDLVRGNARSGVPPHGLPGRNRYCGGITPAQFLRVGSFYRGRTFNFIVPEFNDWFKYKGMVEPLKLVMEQREVKWETTYGTVGPYTFRSYFTVNYNVRVLGNAWESTIGDPNFAALEDRMLLRFHLMTRERFRAVERSAERLELGEIDFHLARKVQDQLSLVYAIETQHPLVRRWASKGVALQPALYRSLREVSEKALARTANPKFSPRLKSRAVKLAAAGALVGYFKHEKGKETTLPVGADEEALARLFYQQEISAREGRTFSAS
ncbi:MAG: hypothetical protein KGJ23_01805 [Euryarchaeota archaeon]|nr:hypothetical protein [Euryarchaeota archaeon]MDE1835330.1 hypothetical protein [Euryarchaeota archaeon]MDE1880775.1 hypothetical protein [Euryarchaeota archaeon]MDE2043626.1 hypothetical protein [Thermoplasmata archaeon]